MQATSVPTKFPIPWAANATSSHIRSIPVASQIGVQAGAASLADGFPPDTFVPEAAGGSPPFGQDTNGILNQITAWLQWVNAGGPVTYDASFATAIGGYPKGAWLTAAAGGSWWLNTADNNTSNPDTGGANWTAVSFGALAALGIGLGLKNDGSGNLALKTASDGSLRLTASGVQANEPITYISGATAVTSATHFANLVANAAATCAIARVNTLWNGFAFAVDAALGAVTLTPDSHDSFVVNGAVGAAGAGFTLQQGQSALFVGDGVGNIAVLFLTAVPNAAPVPPSISGPQTIGTGIFVVDTSGGPITLTLAAGLTGGVQIIDAMGTWGVNPVTLVMNGNTLRGSSANFVLNISGRTETLYFKNGLGSVQ